MSFRLYCASVFAVCILCIFSFVFQDLLALWKISNGFTFFESLQNVVSLKWVNSKLLAFRWPFEFTLYTLMPCTAFMLFAIRLCD